MQKWMCVSTCMALCAAFPVGGWRCAVKPAAAMGLFLRTWRAEWVGMTRGQLALALSARPGVRVPEGVVRAWESGQPPASTAEFDALLDVMAHHGLTRPEIDDFRRAILAAVCDRQYADLFPDEDFAWRDDVVDVAWATHQQAPHPRERDVVNLVCCVQELQAAIEDGAGSRTGRDRVHEQQVALIWMRSALGSRIFDAGRPLQSAQLHDETARLLREFFGSRPPHPLSASGPLAAAAGSRMVGLRTADEVPRLLKLAHRAREAGDDVDYYVLLGAAANGAAFQGTPEMRRAIWPELDHWLRVAESFADWWPEAVVMTRDPLCGAAIRDGELADAERHLAEMQPPREWFLANWLMRMAEFAKARGNYDEAIEHYERLLDYAATWDQRALVQSVRTSIERCDRARMHASRTTQRRVKRAARRAPADAFPDAQ